MAKLYRFVLARKVDSNEEKDFWGPLWGTENTQLSQRRGETGGVLQRDFSDVAIENIASSN